MDIDKILENFNDEKTACTFNSGEVQKNVVPAVLPYLMPFLFFLPLVVDKNSAFCRFHANQQLIWLIVNVIIQVIKGIIGIIPIIGWIAGLLLDVAQLAVAVGLMYGASKGKALRLPFVGELIKIF
ncbi:MAG: DUF4870 domain-containing protein [Ruminococcus sp.]|nr:DUF4870 domain-containing protein [Ruminococcus sp.]